MPARQLANIKGVDVSRVLLLTAFVLFLLATLSAAGITGGIAWAVPGGLTAFAGAWLVP